MFESVWPKLDYYNLTYLNPKEDYIFLKKKKISPDEDGPRRDASKVRDWLISTLLSPKHVFLSLLVFRKLLPLFPPLKEEWDRGSSPSFLLWRKNETEVALAAGKRGVFRIPSRLLRPKCWAELCPGHPVGKGGHWLGLSRVGSLPTQAKLRFF